MNESQLNNIKRGREVLNNLSDKQTSSEDCSFVPDKIHYTLEKAELSNQHKIIVLQKRTECHDLLIALLEKGFSMQEASSMLNHVTLTTDASVGLKKYGFRRNKIGDWDNLMSENSNINLSEFDVHLLNPPYNGTDKGSKPWVTACTKVIEQAKPGAVMGFITPPHFLTRGGESDKYKPVYNACLEHLEHLEVHHLDENTFPVGEKVIYWFGVKGKEKNKLQHMQYFDESGLESSVPLDHFFIKDPLNNLWKSLHKKIFLSDRDCYNSRSEASTEKTLNKKFGNGFVAHERTSQNKHKWYNTTKQKGIWWTKKAGKDFHEPKIIVDASGTYYRVNNINADGLSSPIVVDNGCATAGKNTAQFLVKDIGVTVEQFIWYITHPLMRFVIQEKPGFDGAAFLKELYNIPKITSEINSCEKMRDFFGVTDEEWSGVKEYFLKKGENIEAAGDFL